jgi:hypothetical protein
MLSLSMIELNSVFSLPKYEGPTMSQKNYELG